MREHWKLTCGVVALALLVVSIVYAWRGEYGPATYNAVIACYNMIIATEAPHDPR